MRFSMPHFLSPDAIRYHRSMSLPACLRAWRVSRGHSVDALARMAGLSPDALDAIETGTEDPKASVLDRLATALEIPTSWLFFPPDHMEALLTDADGERAEPGRSADPVMEHIIRGACMHREMYVLLTTLLHRAEPKLLRAAETNLRSLIKQARQTTVPWEQRPPGHFEPPSD
jgi:transcriptional regulator with XRE-family HTH domain